MKPFSVVLKEGHPYGVLAGVALPPEPDPVPEAVLARLHPEEREAALGMRGYRQAEYVGGRLAAAAALRLIGLSGPVRTDPEGAPVPPPRALISISHKRGLAVALAAREDRGRTVGIDLEDLAPARTQIASRVLRPEELAEVNHLDEDRRWISILLRFAIKEALYKALAPRLRRYVGFEEALVEPLPSGTARVGLQLQGEGPVPAIEGRYAWMNARVLAMVRARWP